MRKGSTLSDEHRQKLREKALGRKSTRTPEHNAKIASSLREYHSSLSDAERELRYSRPNFHHSDETKKLLSEQAIADERWKKMPRQLGPSAWNWIPNREDARMRRLLRSMCHRLLARAKNGSDRAAKQLGYGVIDLRQHLENQFVHGMSWQNWGDWHIDHIRPVSSFGANASVAEINALSNLRPIWASDNLRKSAKWEIES